MPFISDNDNLRTTQLVEDFHPVLRRRAYTSIRTSFPTYFQAQHENEQQAPLPSMNESQRIIYENFSKMNHIIDVVDQHIRKRIQCYQNEVVNVVQKEIQQMREQTQKVVIQFNNMILQKNKQTQIWSLNNELDYFKSQAKKLFQSNKQLKRQYLQMKKKIQQYQWQLENREVIMQKLMYKYQKQRHSKIRLKEKMEIGKGLIKINKNKINADEQKKIEIKNVVVDEKKCSNMKKCVKLIEKKEIEKINNKKNNNNYNNNTIHDNSLLQIKLDDENENEYESDQCFYYNNNQNKNQSCLNYQFDQSLDQQQQQSRIQFISKNFYQSVNNTNYKNNNMNNNTTKSPTKQIDQQSQVNIYLSQHSYKTLFDKKYHNNNKINCCNNNNSRSFYANDNNNNNMRQIKQTKEISTQTDNRIVSAAYQNNFYSNNHDQQKRGKLQNNTYQQKSTTSPKTKSINFAKNGFIIRQGSIQKNHLRSNSYHMNSTMMKRDINTNGFVNQTNNNRNKNDRIKTQMNFNKSHQRREFEFQMLTPKVEKTKNTNNHTKIFNKMASKFQRNKIAQRAYDKSVSSSAFGKQ